MIHRYIIEVTDEVKGFEKAIERLDREWGIEELEPCEDCISREQAIKQCGFGMTSLLIADCLRRLPSVKPQRAKGHWMSYTDHQACSRCGKCIAFYADYNYCSNCGANMRGNEE